MGNKSKALFIAMVFGLLAGCATNPPAGPAFSDLAQVPPKQGLATVYIYREYAEPTAWNSTIHVGSEKVATLGQGEYTWIYAQPGNRKISGKWPLMSGQNDAEIELSFAANEVYFVDLIGISQFSHMSYDTMYFNMGSGLNLVKPTEALQRLKTCCRLQSALKPTY